MPPAEMMSRCPSWARRHGAYAMATAATAAPVRPAPSCRTRAYPPIASSAWASTKQDVVAQRGGERAAAEHADRGVTEQAVAEREAVRLGVEGVGLPQPHRVGEQDVARPGDLPCLPGGLAEVLRQGVQRVAQCRPGQGDGQQQSHVDHQGVLVDQGPRENPGGAPDQTRRPFRGGGEGGPRVGGGTGGARGGKRLLLGHGGPLWTWRTARRTPQRPSPASHRCLPGPRKPVRLLFRRSAPAGAGVTRGPR